MELGKKIDEIICSVPSEQQEGINLIFKLILRNKKEQSIENNILRIKISKLVKILVDKKIISEKEGDDINHDEYIFKE